MSKHIFVITEQRGGVIQKVSLELIGEAKRLAPQFAADEKVYAVLLGDNIAAKADLLFEYGADEVLVIDDPMLKLYATEPYTKAVAHLIKKYDPNVCLFGATVIGRDLAPRVAGRVHTGLTADCTKLDVDPESKLFQMTRPAFGGNLMAQIIIEKHRPQMASVRPGVMKMAEKAAVSGKKAIIEESPLVPEDMNIEILEVIPKEKKSVDITEAKVLVAGGRAVNGAEGFKPLRELADELGGEIAATRIPTDEGWIDHDLQVGQTGKTVRPNLYIACGISGAIQHLAGMEESGFIISINKDPNCSMAKTADLAVQGDIKQIVPKLTEAIKKAKASKVVDA